MAKSLRRPGDPAKDKALKLVKFVICSGETGRQVQAIADNINHKAKETGLSVHHSEADEGYSWVLVDLFDVVVHIFTDEARKYYNLEYLWREAKAVTGKSKRKIKRPAKKSRAKRSSRK